MSAGGKNLYGKGPQQRFFRRIGPRLAVSFSLVFVVVLVLIQLAGLMGVPFTPYAGRIREGRAETLKNLGLVADLKKERLQHFLKERRDGLAVSASSSILERNAVLLREAMGDFLEAGKEGAGLWNLMRRESSYEEMLVYLDSVRHTYGVYETIYLVDAESGVVFLSTNSASLGSDLSREVDFGALRTRGSYTKDLKGDVQNLQPHLDFCHAVKGPDGEMIAALVMEVQTDDIIRPMLHTGEGLGKRGEALLVNREGKSLTSLKHPLPDGTMPKVLEYAIRSGPAVLAASGHEGIVEADDYRGEPVLAAYRHIRVDPEWGWGLVVKRDRMEVFAPVRRDIVYSSLLGLAGIGACILLTIALARNLTRPIRSLSDAAEKVGGGDLSVRSAVLSRDEVGFLATTFNDMLERIQHWHVELENEVEARTTDLQVANKDLQMQVEQRERAEKSLARYTEDLERSNRELEQFAYVASHDLQEPLRMVASFTQLLERRYADVLDSDGREFIAYAVDGANRMQALVSDLLAYSRVGTIGKSFSSTNCQAVLERAIRNLNLAIGESDAVVTHDPMPTVKADGTQLLQVFQNLLGNAIKFRSEAPPRIHVGAERRDGDWFFSICDNGIGIEPEHEERIFLLFQRLHSREHYGGTGMGLAICKKIVERHGGRIWMESELGEGTTFYFTLPADEDEER